MAKKKTRPRDPLAGKRHPPFGATKAQARRSQEIRDLKNRIFELESQPHNSISPETRHLIATLQESAIKYDNATQALQKQVRELHARITVLHGFLLTARESDAFRRVLRVSVADALSIDIADDLIVVARWHKRFAGCNWLLTEQEAAIASGKAKTLDAQP